MAKIKKWIVFGTFVVLAYVVERTLLKNQEAQAAACCMNGICTRSDNSPYCC
ncbi:MAG: hypothetical protein PHX68_03200 [Alphaproteobacteria bacterium]|nr:hypothetical protein [Alphaproteobacteria bacterium]